MKKVIIFLVILTVIGVGVGLYLYFRNSSTKSVSNFQVGSNGKSGPSNTVNQGRVTDTLVNGSQVPSQRN